jgi:excinuclease ABC subunit C
LHEKECEKTCHLFISYLCNSILPSLNLASRNALMDKVRNLPDEPGVYRFLNDKGKLLYIGKAKSLRKRVSSYFLAGRGHSYRIHKMVEQAADIAYTVVHSEVEALLLENNLIKQNQPKYNILLKDGKTYPYICVKNERFPRVFATRQKEGDGSLYFGPYPSASAMKAILELIRSFLKLRTCSYVLSQENIAKKKFKLCLEYQIGNCGGPCEGLVPEADYMEGIEQAKHVLRGNLSPVIQFLEKRMREAAAKMEFEKADYFKKRIEKVRVYKQKATVVSEKINNLEVMAVEAESELAIVHHFKVQEGTIVQTHAWEFRIKNQEEPAEILAAALNQMQAEEIEMYPELVSNIELLAEDLPDGVSLTVPQRGDKKHLVDLALKNSRTLLDEKLYAQNFKKRKSFEETMMEELQAALHLKELPDHIECFDNSNFQGSSPVASMVVFKGGKPSKADYRHFNIKTVEGPNDFASMEEIVGRRYRRVQEEGLTMPKLIVIDGGKGQLGAAVDALSRLGLAHAPIIGIAKRLEEIYRPGDPYPLHLDKRSPALTLIQQIRNEAHRFAITFHRTKRSNDPSQKSKLTLIKGIGPQAEKEILALFKSVKKLKAASDAELEAKLGLNRARLIRKGIEEGII